MEVELLCRFLKPFKDEEIDMIEDDLKNWVIANGEEGIDLERERLYESMREYEYEKMVINLNEVWGFNYASDEHFSIRFKSGINLMYKGKYEDFKKLYEKVVKRSILTLE